LARELAKIQFEKKQWYASQEKKDKIWYQKCTASIPIAQIGNLKLQQQQDKIKMN
jgi:hypothetical protein